MRNKQLGALLSAVPPATARPASPAVSTPQPPRSAREVPLQVLIPGHVREELGILAARERASLRALVLRAGRGLGIEVSDEEIRDKRGRRAMNS